MAVRFLALEKPLMIRTRAALLFTFCFSLALLGPLSAGALAQGLPSVRNEIKTANEVSGHRASIEQFVSQATAQLASESPDEQSRARDALQREALVNGQPNASPAYLNLYTQLLNQQLLTLAQNPSTRVRLNAAIVTASVARLAKLANLAPAAMAFINDKSPAVVLWGVKAGRPLVAAQLRVIGAGGGPKIADAVVAAVKQHRKGTIAGAIAVDAYDALTLDVTNPAVANTLTPQMIQAVIPLVHDLMAFRIGEFRRGVPPEPGADRTGAGFLVHPKVWPVQTPQQQQKTIQLLSDLLALAAEQGVKASAQDQAYLVRIVQLVATSISVAASNSGEPGIVQAVTPVAQPPRGVGAAQMAQMVKAVYPAIKASGKYAGTTEPPAVLGNEPPPPPASAPTTGPVAIPGASGAAPITAPAGAAGPIRPAPTTPAPQGARPAAPAPTPATPAPPRP